MMTLAYLLAVVVITVAFWAAHLAFWSWYYTRHRTPDERHYVTTDDQWRLALARIRPRAAGPAQGDPVICFPGLACNGRLFDLDDDHSLAQHLAGLGFDVWLVDPRGTGHSERPSWLRRGWGFGFGEYALQDAPAAIRHVVRVTGRDRVLWVGHSMGGLVGYQVALHAVGDHLAGIVSIGSPADFSSHRAGLGWLHTQVLDRFLRGWPVVRLGRLCTAIAPLAGWWRGWPETLFTVARNTPVSVLRHFLVEVVEDVPRKLLDQFADHIVRDLGFDGRPASATHTALAQAQVPVLAIAGSRDRVAPPSSVVAAVTLMGCEDATECVVGNTDTTDFGHLDLLVGRAAPQVIYPQVGDWLLAHRTAAPAGPVEPLMSSEKPS